MIGPVGVGTVDEDVDVRVLVGAVLVGSETELAETETAEEEELELLLPVLFRI